MSLLRALSFLWACTYEQKPLLSRVPLAHLVASCSRGDITVVLIALAFTAGDKRPRFARAEESCICPLEKTSPVKIYPLGRASTFFFLEAILLTK